jgi:hypothetical protein
MQNAKKSSPEMILFYLSFSRIIASISATSLEGAYLCDSLPDEGTISYSYGGSGLDSFVGTNLLQEMLYDPTCKFDSKCIDKYLPDIIKAMIFAGAGIIVGVLVLVLFLLFSPCLCSRRCRRWSGWKRVKESPMAHDFNPKLGHILLALTALVCIGGIVYIGLIGRQKVEVNSGLNSALCETYRFLNESLNGGSVVSFDTSLNYQVTAQFPGLNNASSVLRNVSSLVAPGSELLTSLDNFMNYTGLIENELTTLQGWLFALSASMLKNKISNRHTSLLSTNFSVLSTSQYSPINPSMISVNNSLGGVLTSIRSQVRPFVLSGVDSVYYTLDTTAVSLDSFVKNLTNVVESSVLSNLSLIHDITHYFDLTLIIVLVLSFLPIFFSLFVVIKGVYFSNRDTYTDPNIRPVSPTFVSTFMWFTLLYTVIIFFVSGAVLIVANLISSTCLIMEDAGTVAAKLSFRFGSPSIASQVVGITQQCLQAGTDGDLLSAIIINGQSTARDKLNTLAALSGQLSVIENAVNSGTANTNLSTDVYLNNLGRYVGEVGDLLVITKTTNDTVIAKDASLAPKSSAPIFSTNYANGLSVYNTVVTSVPQCADRSVAQANTPIGVQALLANYTFNSNTKTYAIPGFSSVLTILQTNGVSTGVNTCPSSAQPTLNLVPWGNLLSLKLKVMADSALLCSAPVVKYNATTYLFNTTLSTTTCNRAQYQTYMQDYGTKISQQAQEVDSTVDTYFESIFDILWSVLLDQLTEPIQIVSSTLNCQFISIRWNALFESLCRTFAPNLIRLGNALFALGFLGVFSLIVEIVIWRHLKDNKCHWQDYIESPEDARRVNQRMSVFANMRLSGLWNAWGSQLFSRRSSVSGSHPGAGRNSLIEMAPIPDDQEVADTSNPRKIEISKN